MEKDRLGDNMEYLKIENGIITGHYSGDIPDDGCLPLNGEFWGVVGEPVDWYDENFNRIDDITLIKNGKKEMPEGMKFNDTYTELVAMEYDEQVVAGLQPLAPNQKIVDGQLVEKTIREMWLDGSISTEQFTEYKRRERDSALTSTDKYMLVDFPVDDEYRQQIREYRQSLRDITKSTEWPDVDIPKVPSNGN